MIAPGVWFRETKRTYVGNAAAQRDFRVQLRGNRSMILFGVYLAILIWTAAMTYSNISASSSVSIIEAQSRLQNFYEMIVMLLGGMVTLIAPGLAATTIVTERQRRSLDLVFSAPVSPRYYLVGKMIAVYRYIWMLLILSLPVTATCVVLGGASWSDVLTVYALLSIHGLLFASIGLMISTMCAKPVSAIIWSYLVSAGYLGLSGMMAAAAYSSRFAGFGRGVSNELPFAIALNPFAAIYAVGTKTVVWGHDVPNWILGGIATLILLRMCLLGAGALLSDGRETPKLRLSWLLIVLVVPVLAIFSGLGTLVGASRAISTSPGSMPGPAFDMTHAWGIASFWILFPLILALPNLAAYGDDGFQRQKNNGGFSLRHIFDGSPAGSLPYLYALVAVSYVSIFLAGRLLPGVVQPKLGLLAYAAYTAGFWTLIWSVGRYASSAGTGLKTARTMVIGSLIVLLALPVPFLSALTFETFSQAETSAWDLYILRPVMRGTGSSFTACIAYALVMFLVAAIIYLISERRYRLKKTAHA